MSVFFPRTPTASADQGFTPLFRLLEDFDSYKGSQVGSPRSHRGHLPTFQPKFDVRETEDSYELHGELPGMNKSDVNIEFADPQTMVVRGRIERTYTSGTSPASVEGKKAESITQAGEESPKRHQATVDDEEEGFTEVSAPSKETKKAGPRDNAKYWVSERSIGEFSRSFNFPGHVDPEAVSATLRDGILSVIVPKHKKSAGRRILVE
ncbi:related to heat shock protein 30 [Cephalotrichum gorgonifer]|uniref:Related to heat shock protein 30 n=1 Tax=Cephalotrichum gorgonifer TaxID=2041049 RepID=A0AAE8N3M4_9PEZI|nr:related to heat shock protein 30 [Cephalotrichum gorgonifer]